MVRAMLKTQKPPLSLEARGLAVRRSGRIIFEGLSLSLNGGESAVVTGPNGSGKSTLLRVLAGLLQSEAGSVTVQPDDRQAVCYAGHRDGLKGALTVLENLVFWAKIYGTNTAAAERAIHRLALDQVADMPADMLSAGWRRRAGLARLALNTSPVWILDEPYTALDTENVSRIDSVLSEHVATGGIAILATHQAPGFAPTHKINMADFRPSAPMMTEMDW